MKRGTYILSLLTVLVLLFTGCEKKYTSEDDSRIVYYVDIQLEKADNEIELVDKTVLMLVELGTPFVEPGFTAFEGDQDKTSTVVISGSVDANTVGIYPLAYSAENSEGYAAAASRLVAVYDPNASPTDLTGDWMGVRVGVGGGPTTIEMVAPGIFYCSDMFGGYYEVVAGYGSAYRLRSFIQLLNNNTYVGLQTDSPWGPWLIQNGVYDPGSGTMSHRSFLDWAGFGFDVVLTKQ